MPTESCTARHHPKNSSEYCPPSCLRGRCQKSKKKAVPYGLGQSIPIILIADHSGNVVKRFSALPDKTILNALLERLEEGRLENGTLPIDQRVDTWKMNRKGM